MSLFEPIFDALNARDVRYVVVGGVAVVLQGHARLTLDVDLVVDLEPAGALRAMEALTALGLEPAVPVDARAFADPETRAGWIAEKNMQVFPLRDPSDIRRRVDVFVEDPIPFEELWGRSVVVELGATRVRVASIDDLITMKRSAGRPQDIADIEALIQIKESRGDGS